MGFHATNSGPDQGNGGTYAAGLDVKVSSVKISLTHKQVIHNAHSGTHVIFSGKASGGDASVHDTYSDSGAQSSGQETHNGPLSYGGAALFFDLNKCKYQLTVSFGVETTVTGSVDAGSHPTVTGTAYGDRSHIPGSLSLSDGVLPPPYGGACPGNPLKSGQPCYKFGVGIIGLCSTSDLGTDHCPSDPVGHANFGWDLKPK